MQIPQAFVREHSTPVCHKYWTLTAKTFAWWCDPPVALGTERDQMPFSDFLSLWWRQWQGQAIYRTFPFVRHFHFKIINIMIWYVKLNASVLNLVEIQLFLFLFQANRNKSTHRYGRGSFMGDAMLNAVASFLSYTKLRVVQPQSRVIDKNGFFLKF